MPGVEVVYPSWALNDHGPIDDLEEKGDGVRVMSSPVFMAHKPLPRRRHFSENAANLRSLFNTAEMEPLYMINGDRNLNMAPSTPKLSTTPSLLPTPPSVQHEFSEYGFDDSSNAETTILRSGIVTPSPQQSPPTPDVTPPRLEASYRIRPFLGTQPSLASTRAESFQTAREDMSSDEEHEDSYPTAQRLRSSKWSRSPLSMSKEHFHARPSPLARDDETAMNEETGKMDRNEMKTLDVDKAKRDYPSIEADSQLVGWSSPAASDPRSSDELEQAQTQILEDHISGDVLDKDQHNHSMQHSSPQSNLPTPPSSADEEIPTVTQAIESEVVGSTAAGTAVPPTGEHLSGDVVYNQIPRRGQSLRERVEESQRIESSPSTEHFAKEIGWSRPSRALAIAAAYDDGAEPAPADFGPILELRNRVDSWRLSGVSTTSTVEAIVVDNEPQRHQTLRHRGRNESLRSASSPIPSSNRNSLRSNPDSLHRLVHKKARLSNHNRWSFDSEVSRSFSMSSSAALQLRPEVIRVAVIPERSSSLHSSSNSSKRHSASLSASSAGQKSVTAIGRSNGHEHRRAASDSVSSATQPSYRGRGRRYPPVAIPTRSSSLSAPTSRSHSRANSITSEHLRSQRVAAEEDVRMTLARMESERMITTMHAQTTLPNASQTPPIEPGTAQWASLRPSSTLDTPFTQPSLHSSSPPVEMGEARAVNFFPHNNNSLQIVESNQLVESRALQDLYTPDHVIQTEEDKGLVAYGSLLPMLQVESPLRNPREPPVPPQFKIIPPTPASLSPADDVDRRFMDTPSRKGSTRRFGSLRRPSLATRRYSESFVKSLGRSLSLNARNKKADQDLDGKLHPFWRPQGFWDEFSESDDDYDDRDVGRDRSRVVNNSLGIPQKRTVMDGPLSLVRSLSDGSGRRRQERGVSKRSSYGSLSRMRTGRKIHKVPGLGLRFQVVGLRDLQQRMLSVKRRKEDERREKRRQELRSSIGANVVSQGDSRFPRRIESASGIGETGDFN